MLTKTEEAFMIAGREHDLWRCLVCGCVACRDLGDCLVLVCSVTIPPTVFPLCLCGLATLVSGRFSGK